jgi:hypothetical protein
MLPTHRIDLKPPLIQTDELRRQNFNSLFVARCESASSSSSSSSFVCSIARKNWLEEEEEKKSEGKKLSKNNNVVVVVVVVVYSQLGYSTVGAISLICFAMSVWHVRVS